MRWWPPSQIFDPATVRFLRFRNREGYDVYFRPYAGDHNAGYILLDLDCPAIGLPAIHARLRAQGHEPSVVLETSPGHGQAWVRVSREPLAPALATRVSRRLAQLYQADPASADWRHVGRLAGFTNRKPHRRLSSGLAPWVKLIHARDCLASDGGALIQLAAAESGDGTPQPPGPMNCHPAEWLAPTACNSSAQRLLYHSWLQRLRILERYPSPDWSIADKWVARGLLETGMSLSAVTAVLRHGSPGFPRRHADPEDYLSRTIHCAVRQIRSSLFSRARSAAAPWS